jgi:Tol biopolymer transport system component
MLFRVGSAGRVALVVLSAAAILSTGCAHTEEEVSIAPLAPAAGRVDPGLGPGTRALSSGPGYKGSPSWSPEGDRIAFTVDGYVVDKSADSEDRRRWAAKDMVAEDTEWVSEDTLMILGATSVPPSGKGEISSALYRALVARDSMGLERVGKEASAIVPERKGLVFALANGPHESRLALARSSGKVHKLRTTPIEGRVAALSLTPGGAEAVLAVRPPGDDEVSALRVFDLRTGRVREIARLDGDREILGTPQWAEHGIYFVAGKKATAVDSDGSEPLYDIYRVPKEGGTPEPAPGVGEDFVAASIRVSPDRKRLAVIGRLNQKAPTNLYMLDPLAKDLTAVTTNEDMEIKTGQDDLAWSPGGKSVTVIARGTPSTEPEVHAEPADRLLRDFYNLYEIPVGGSLR